MEQVCTLKGTVRLISGPCTLTIRLEGALDSPPTVTLKYKSEEAEFTERWEADFVTADLELLDLAEASMYVAHWGKQELPTPRRFSRSALRPTVGFGLGGGFFTISPNQWQIGINYRCRFTPPSQTEIFFMRVAEKDLIEFGTQLNEFLTEREEWLASKLEP